MPEDQAGVRVVSQTPSAGAVQPFASHFLRDFSKRLVLIAINQDRMAFILAEEMAFYPLA